MANVSVQIIKPCPFCGETDVAVSKDMSEDGSVYARHVECPNCEARGPIRNTADDAIEVWNAYRVDQMTVIYRDRGVPQSVMGLMRDDGVSWFNLGDSYVDGAVAKRTCSTCQQYDFCLVRMAVLGMRLDNKPMLSASSFGCIHWER